MKHFILFLASLFFGLHTFAQKKVNKGYIDYSISIETDNAMIKKMLDGSTATYYFNKKNALVDMNMGMVKNKTFINQETKEIKVFLDMMGMKKFIKKKMDEEEVNEEASKVTFTATDEVKTLCGHKCKKGIITKADGEKIEVYYTKDFTPAVKFTSESNKLFQSVPGYLMEYEVEQNGMKMKFTATRAIFDKLDASKMAEPTGYTEMTEDELKMMGGGSDE